LATFTFTKDTFRLNLSPAESRALERPSLSLDKTRLISARLLEFPGKVTLGYRVSKPMLFNNLLGEYRTSAGTTLVLGKLKGSTEALKITISHPGIDQIWVCGVQALELEEKLNQFLDKKPA